MASGQYEFQSDFARKHYSEGLAAGEARGVARGELKGLIRGRAEGILAVLAGRGLAVTDDQRHRIESATDPASLARWLERSLTISSVDELFDCRRLS